MTETTPAGQRYRDARWKAELLKATPPEVWQQYRESGYTLDEALAQEVAYG